MGSALEKEMLWTFGIGIIQAPRELSIDLPDEITQDEILATIEAELGRPTVCCG